MDYIPGSGEKIFQGEGVFPFSADTLALSAFARPRGRVVDLGAGTGLLSIRAAQVPRVEVVAVEGNPRAQALIEKSVAVNGMENITVVTADIFQEDFVPRYRDHFDTVITNPPYYQGSLQGANARAKHENGPWFSVASRILKSRGHLYAILPPRHLQWAMALFAREHLSILELQPVYKRPGEEAFRILIHARKNVGENLKMLPARYLDSGEEGLCKGREKGE
ncbi:MAG: methyltransferase [Tissierellia bacterium]|nr:methyltransferase [Tissierellia bacterium]